MSKYTEQIERLTENPGLINSEWRHGKGLFAFVGRTGVDTSIYDCSCISHDI